MGQTPPPPPHASTLGSKAALIVYSVIRVPAVHAMLPMTCFLSSCGSTCAAIGPEGADPRTVQADVEVLDTEQDVATESHVHFATRSALLLCMCRGLHCSTRTAPAYNRATGWHWQHQYPGAAAACQDFC